MIERVAIVGTAQTWRKTPWTDSGLHVRSLNDAYRMKGFVRADAWYDLHPLDKFYHPDGEKVYAHQIPPGHYCRPKDHLHWLGSQTIPVFLHPDYATQHPAAAEWPLARAFPKAAVEDHFGAYFSSSPGWMIGQALMDGVKELHIYGIHLATEHEYIEQRPNFEMLCGALLGRGKRRMVVTDGMRRYESSDGILVLPEAAPVLQAKFQYAFEERPGSHDEAAKWEIHKLQVKQQRLMKALAQRPTWHPFVRVPNPTTGNVETLTVPAALTRLTEVSARADDMRDVLIRQQNTGAFHG